MKDVLAMDITTDDKHDSKALPSLIMDAFRKYGYIANH